MRAYIRVTAAVLVPLLALAPSCAAPNRKVRLEPVDGPPVDFVAESGGTPIAIPEAELWESFRKAVRHVVVKADPLAAAEEAFELAEGSGTYRYFVRSGLLVPETLHGLEEVEGAGERMTREYREWCGGTRMGGGEVLGPQMGQLLILLVSHSLGKGIAGTPRLAEANAQAQRLLHVRLAAAGAVRHVTLGAGVITISLATGASAMVGSPSDPGPEASAPTLRNLGRQLAAEEAAGAFKPNGELSDEALKGAQQIFEPGELGNPAIPKGFGKYTTRFFRSPSGWFQVHFYMNPATGEVFYGLDYKVVLKNGVKVYTPGGG